MIDDWKTVHFFSVCDLDRLPALRSGLIFRKFRKEQTRADDLFIMIEVHFEVFIYTR